MFETLKSFFSKFLFEQIRLFGSKVATTNAISGFKATGIYPYNPQAIPDHAYYISDERLCQTQNAELEPSESSDMSNIQNNHNSVIQINEETSDRPTSPQPGPSTRITPTKILLNISPIPRLPSSKPHPRRQLGEVLNSIKKISTLKEKNEAKLKKEKKTGIIPKTQNFKKIGGP